jgi:DNA-binding CsgD family transcriptional regulator/tetratricopeptide (TPR) repeat protein
VPVLLVASYRDDELDRSHPLRVVLGDLPSRGAVDRVRVPPLSREAVEVLAEPYGLDPDELYRRTDGNPFFVTEVLAAGSRELPETVRDAVLARTARLPAPARALLDAVAISPRRAELWLLEAVATFEAERLDECLRTGVLMPEPDGVAFRHELARLVVEDSIPPDRAIALHRRALAALAEPPVGRPDLSRIAHHAEAARDTKAVLRYATAAAEHAASVGAHREAEAQYARALRFADEQPPEARAELLERFADESYLTDMREAGVDALREALAVHRERGDLRRQGETLRRLARVLGATGSTTEARSAADEAVVVLERLRPGGELARAYSTLSHVSMLASDHEEAIAWGTRAIELAERVGETEALVNALNNIGVVESTLDTVPGNAHAKLERSIELAREAGLDHDAARAYNNLASVAARRREWTLVDRCVDAGIDFCREHGLEAKLNFLVVARAQSELGQGRWSSAAATAMEVLELPPSNTLGARFEALIVLALVRARRGDPEHWPLLAEALERAQAAGDLQFLATVAAARAEAAWLEGRPEAIASETQAAYELAVERNDPWFAGELACWRQRAGLPPERPLEVGEPYARQLAGDWAGAAKHWRQLGCPYETALSLASAHKEAALRQALEGLRQLGAGPAAAIVARRLRERGARGLPRGPRPTTRRNPANLTTRELDVLVLLVQGLRNAQIAERLVLSKSTVDHHVAAILRKLDARTRGEATAKAVRLGLAGQDS